MQSAIESITSFVPSYYDLVITDIRTKSPNGLQLHHRIKSIDPNLKVILVSVLDAVEELVSVLPGRAREDIIRKPVNEQEFVNRIKDVLSKVHVESRLAPSNNNSTARSNRERYLRAFFM